MNSISNRNDKRLISIKRNLIITSLYYWLSIIHALDVRDVCKLRNLINLFEYRFSHFQSKWTNDENTSLTQKTCRFFSFPSSVASLSYSSQPSVSFFYAFLFLFFLLWSKLIRFGTIHRLLRVHLQERGWAPLRRPLQHHTHQRHARLLRPGVQSGSQRAQRRLSRFSLYQGQRHLLGYGGNSPHSNLLFGQQQFDDGHWDRQDRAFLRHVRLYR